jgi:hypothetical protein
MQTPQQNNGHDCGPATATTLIHLLRRELLETVLDGPCFRFSHLAMIFNAVCGPCPFRFGDDNGVAYSIPQTGSLIDIAVAGLLRERNPMEIIRTDMIVKMTSCVIPAIVAGNTTRHMVDQTDAQAETLFGYALDVEIIMLFYGKSSAICFRREKADVTESSTWRGWTARGSGSVYSVARFLL